MAKSRPKLIVMGHARHGKDTVCEILRDAYGYRFVSSSMFCAEGVVFTHMQDRYATAEECFADRHNRRAEWFDRIADYNREDPTALGRAILAEHDIYCGIRNRTEFQAMRNARVFHASVWVDASDRHPSEDRSSCTVEPWMADFVLDNNRTLRDLEKNLASLYVNRIRPLEVPRVPAE